MTKEQIANELALVRAQQLQLRKQVLELGCKTAQLSKNLLDLADQPKRPAGMKT